MKTTEQKVPALRFPEFEGEWEVKKLGEVILNFRGGASLTPKDFVAHSDYEVIPKKGITGGGKLLLNVDNLTYCSPNFFLSNLSNVIDKSYLITTLRDLVPSGPNIGYIVNYNTEKEYILAQGVYGFKIDNCQLIDSFLIQYSNTYKYRCIMKRIMVGSTQVHIRNTIFQSIIIPFPSLPEQQKIADFLSATDKRLELLKEKKLGLEDYKRGTMQRIFSQELRFTRPDGSAYEDWEEKKLGEIGEIITGKTPSTNDELLWNGNILFITPTDIIEGRKYQKETLRTVINQKEIKVLPLGSVVYTCIGSIGKIAITTIESCTNQQINSIVIDSRINNEFIYYTLKHLTPYIKSLPATTTLPIINKTEFSAIKISLPSLEEQTQIANFLSAIDVKIEKLSEQIEATENYKKGLLQQMFV